jgi:hypothetical protein
MEVVGFEEIGSLTVSHIRDSSGVVQKCLFGETRFESASLLRKKFGLRAREQ